MRLRLDLAYDGAAFSGWAAQPGRRTVQGVLEQALGVVSRGAASPLTVAGRTDAGVHARGQVAHADVAADVADDPLLLRRLNGVLPDDVRVLAVCRAPEGFDARFCALSRTYCYRVADAPSAQDPLVRAFVLAWPRPLDVHAMSAAGSRLLGEHDFAAFCRRREGGTTVRTMLALDWSRGADGVAVMTVTADAFCHSMVRSLVGAMLAVGDRRRRADWLTSLLTLGARSSEVAVAPAHGLVLERVDYPPDDQLAARQQVTRSVRGAVSAVPPVAGAPAQARAAGLTAAHLRH